VVKTINFQITLSLFGLFLAGFLVVLIVVDHLLTVNLRDDLMSQMRLQCLLADELIPSGTDSLQPRVEHVARLIEGRVTVVDETGRVLADSHHRQRVREYGNHLNHEEIQQAIRSVDGFGSSIRYSETINADLLYLAYKSPNRRFIRIARHQESLETIVDRVRTVFVVSALAILALSILASHLIARRIMRPLSAIIDSAQEIKSGHYDREIVVRENNEFGELGRMLNAMSTRLKDDIEQLRKLQDIRRDFVANASHELRTPVSSIRGYVETLLDGALHDESVSRRFLERALSNVLRLESIVQDMLDLSRLESRDRGLSLRYVDVSASIRNVMAEWEDSASRKGLRLLYETDLPADFRLLADPYQLEKALVNLIDNGIKYTETGHVRIQTHLTADRLEISVEDTGCGILPEEIPRIFERFYRVDKGRSRQMGGSGLGLSIVRHIMDIHRGSVSVESEVGRGSRFILLFPLHVDFTPSKGISPV
jgi:two-component system phosphate regulon sensor histidine kinase PhoR